MALSHASFAQSALTDDAHTSTVPKSIDANFGTNPNFNVSASGNIYLKFKLSSTLRANTPDSELERATLKLYLGNIQQAQIEALRKQIEDLALIVCRSNPSTQICREKEQPK